MESNKKYTELSLDDICSDNKILEYFKTRYVVCWILYTIEKMPLSEIARLIKKRHSTVIYGINKIKNNSDLRDFAIFLSNKINKEYEQFIKSSL